MATLREFDRATRALRLLERWPWRTTHKLQARLDADTLRAAKIMGYRGKSLQTARAKALPLLEWLATPYRARQTAVMEFCRWGKDKVNEWLYDASMSLTPEQTETEVLLYSCSTLMYASQGYGALKYTKEHCNLYADKARSRGIAVRLQFGKAGSDRWGIAYGVVNVWAKTNDMGKKIVLYSPEMTLREWVKSCWARGVNPRVYQPFLPYGYEEQNGLDYFGGDVAEEPKDGTKFQY